MKYQIIDEDEKKYQIMHPDGSKFHVAKSGISKDLMAKINELPKYNKGGKVKGYADGGTVEDPNADARKKAEQYMGAVMPDEQAAEPKADNSQVLSFLKEPEQPAAETMPDRAPGQDVSVQQEQPVDNGMGAYDKIFNQQIAGAQAATGNAAKLANVYETQLQNNQLEKEKLAAEHQARMADLQQKANAIAAVKEDPERIYKTGGHNKWLAAAAIGLGASGNGPNPAMEIINNRIKQDIEAQRNDKNSLFNANLQEFKNEEIAYNLTAQNLLGKAENAAKIFQTKMGVNQMGQQQNNFMAQLQLQREALNQKLNQDVGSKMILSKAASGKRLSPEEQMMLPEKYQKNLLPDGRYAPIQPSDKDRQTIAAAQNIKSGLQELITRVGTTVPGSVQDKENKAKVTSLQLAAKEAYSLGAISGTDYEMIQNLIPDPGAIRSDAVKAQLNASIQSMNRLEDSVYKKVGVKPEPRPVQVSGGRLTLNK